MCAEQAAEPRIVYRIGPKIEKNHPKPIGQPGKVYKTIFSHKKQATHTLLLFLLVIFLRLTFHWSCITRGDECTDDAPSLQNELFL